MFLGKYKIGERVKVEREDNLYLFRKENITEKVKYYFRSITRKLLKHIR
jgi:hypothetical protein